MSAIVRTCPFHPSTTCTGKGRGQVLCLSESEDETKVGQHVHYSVRMSQVAFKQMEWVWGSGEGWGEGRSSWGVRLGFKLGGQGLRLGFGFSIAHRFRVVDGTGVVTVRIFSSSFLSDGVGCKD